MNEFNAVKSYLEKRAHLYAFVFLADHLTNGSHP